MNYLKNKCRGNLVIVNIVTLGIAYLISITAAFSDDNILAKSDFGQKKEIAVVTSLMFYGKNNVFLVPMGINFHAKLLPNISMGIGYSFNIDDHLVGVSHSYNPKNPQGYRKYNSCQSPIL